MIREIQIQRLIRVVLDCIFFVAGERETFQRFLRTGLATEGIAMVQIAEGAMAEIEDMLHRGSELSIKAANGILKEEDHAYIQMEIAQIKEGIDGIARRIDFNEIQVLKGNIAPDIEENNDVRA